MGTPEFALGTLSRLVEGGYNVVAVVTQPDKPVGRHQDKLQASAVKQYALAHSIPVLQPVKMKDPDFVERLADLKADLQVVVAFRMLPERVWAMPRFGAFNVHAALLRPPAVHPGSVFRRMFPQPIHRACDRAGASDHLHLRITALQGSGKGALRHNLVFNYKYSHILI